jgi:hypothetical protein
MVVQVFRFERRAALGQVSRAGAIHPLDGGDATGDQRRVFQHANAQRQVVTLAQQVHRPVTQVHFHRDLAVALQKRGSKQPRWARANDSGALTRRVPRGSVVWPAMPCSTCSTSQQAQGRFVVTLPQGRDVQAPGRTVEQSHAEALFELHQAPADKLLGQPQLIGRGREAAGVHHLAKNTHVFERVHCHAPVDSKTLYSGFFPFAPY